MDNFFERSKISILFIGYITLDYELISSVKKFYQNIRVHTDEKNILQCIEEDDPSLIISTFSYKENIYEDILRIVKLTKPNIEIILLVDDADCQHMRNILALDCDVLLHVRESKDKIIKTILYSIREHETKLIGDKSRKYFEVLLENSIVSKSDTQGNITYINENFTNVTGYAPSECLGKNHNLLRHPENGIAIYEDMWNTITQGNVWRERVLNKNKDGSDFWAETTIIPYREPRSKKIVEYIAIRRDITSMLKLKRQVHEQEAKAQQQNKITEAKDSFLVLFTHELKTPLNAIINFSKYLLKHVSEETIDQIPMSKQQHLLEQINSSAQTMLSDVSNILDISRLKSHKLTFSLASFDLQELILEVIRAHEDLAVENRTNVCFENGGFEPFITSDRVRFKQILANIISNAIKYSFGEVKITISCTIDEVSVIVEDNGKGIEDKEIVFELFEQSGKGLLNKEKKGTGIGLSFVKLLCEDLKLEYKLEDSLDMGGLKFILTKNIRVN